MKVYIYPSFDSSGFGNKNPYLYNLSKSLVENGVEITNTKKENTSIIYLFKNFRNTNFFILNWIEDLPSRRFGFIQTILFVVFVLMCKAFGKKIVWFRHNKISHDKKYYFLKKNIAGLLNRFSSLVISHSQEGVNIEAKNNFYFPHPATAENIHEYKSNNEYDILIWGEIQPYKGIHNFFKYCSENKDQVSDLKILIAGSCNNEEYFQSLTKLATANIEIRRGFVTKENLHDYFSKSRSVLFIYENLSVLSSGASIDTLCGNRKIIGPDFSCFKELESIGLVFTYKSLEDIFKVLEQPSADNSHQISIYYKNYSWQNFAEQLILKMSEVSQPLNGKQKTFITKLADA